MQTGPKVFLWGIAAGIGIGIGLVWGATVAGDIGQRVIVKDCITKGAFTVEGRTYTCEKL